MSDALDNCLELARAGSLGDLRPLKVAVNSLPNFTTSPDDLEIVWAIAFHILQPLRAHKSAQWLATHPDPRPKVQSKITSAEDLLRSLGL